MEDSSSNKILGILAEIVKMLKVQYRHNSRHIFGSLPTTMKFLAYFSVVTPVITSGRRHTHKWDLYWLIDQLSSFSVVLSQTVSNGLDAYKTISVPAVIRRHLLDCKCSTEISPDVGHFHDGRNAPYMLRFRLRRLLLALKQEVICQMCN